MDCVDRKALRDALYDADAITMEGVKILNQFPSADVAPVRHGYWRAFTCPTYRGLNDYGDPIFKDGVVYYCSECDRKTVIKENYCPNCGAKMDLEMEDA